MRRALLAVALPWQIVPWPSETPPTVDGRLDEAAWSSIPAYEEFYQILPQAGPAAFKTSVRLTRDTTALYIGVVMDDPPDGERQSNVSRRDHIASTDDQLTITLDPLGTRSFAQFFSVNPDCSINDGTYQESNLLWDGTPDFAFQVGCQTWEGGWSVEFKIPWRELRFSQDSSTPWNILVDRSVVRSEFRTVSNIPQPRDPLCLLCLAPALEGAKDLPDPSFFRFTPYALGRLAERDQVQAGFDVKYRPSPDDIFDITVHPDFSQVSLDEPQLAANTQFAVFYPENRPFFLEGADILETPLRVINTRSIKQPSWGAKFTRRSSNQDTMVLAGDDDSHSSILIPGTYGSRFRPIAAIQKFAIGSSHWKGEAYNLGLNMAVRSYADKGSNQSLGMDGMHYISAVDSLRWQTQFTASTNRWDPEDEAILSSHQQDGAAQYLLFQHKGELWYNRVEVKNINDAFRTDLGFNPRAAYRLGIVQNGLNQDYGDTHAQYYLRQSHKEDRQARTIQTQNAGGVTLTGFHGVDLTLETTPNTLERIRADSRLHRYQQHSVSFSVFPGAVLTSLSCDWTFGERLDVANDRVRPGRADGCVVRLALSKRLEWTSSAHEEVMPGVLTNQAFNHLLVLPLRSLLSLRLIRQEEKVDRSGSTRSLTQTDSWNLAYEDIGGLTVYGGATLTRVSADTRETHREYYLKVSTSLP